MFQQAVLDLGREMVLTAADDHVFDTAGDGNIAAHIHLAQIAGMQPSSRVNSLGCGLGVVVVFQHDTGAAGTDFPDFPNGNGAIVIDISD